MSSWGMSDQKFDFEKPKKKSFTNPIGCPHGRERRTCDTDGPHHPGCPKLSADLVRFKQGRREWERKGGFHGR